MRTSHLMVSGGTPISRLAERVVSRGSRSRIVEPRYAHTGAKGMYLKPAANDGIYGVRVGFFFDVAPYR